MPWTHFVAPWAITIITKFTDFIKFLLLYYWCWDIGNFFPRNYDTWCCPCPLATVLLFKKKVMCVLFICSPMETISEWRHIFVMPLVFICFPMTTISEWEWFYLFLYGNNIRVRVNLFVSLWIQNPTNFKSVFQNVEKLRWCLELQREQSCGFLSVCKHCCRTSLHLDIDSVYLACLFIHNKGFIALVNTCVTYV